ncbi:MAG: hypothetical protein RI903_1443 [Bacteroidota bacterium]|jgi:hypothetical protein
MRGLTKVGKESFARIPLANLASLKNLRADLERIAKGTPELNWQGLPKGARTKLARIAKGEQTLSILNHLSCLSSCVARFDKGGEG